MYFGFKLLVWKQCAFLIRFALFSFCVMARKKLKKGQEGEEEHLFFFREETMSGTDKEEEKRFLPPLIFLFPEEKVWKTNGRRRRAQNCGIIYLPHS